MTPEEVWRSARNAHNKSQKSDFEARNRAAIAVIRTAMEAYAAQKVAEVRVRYVRAISATPEQQRHARKSPLYQLGDMVLVWVNEADIYRAMQAANQHHGGNDADT